MPGSRKPTVANPSIYSETRSSKRAWQPMASTKIRLQVSATPGLASMPASRLCAKAMSWSSGSSTVSAAIVLEAGSIAALGAIFGFLVYGAIVFGAAGVVRAQTGVHLEIASFHPMLIGAPLGMVVLGTLAGLLPAAVAYSTDVAENLLPTS